MKLTLESTDKLESIEGAPCRLWIGTTDKGVPVHVYVRTLSPQTHDEAQLADFDMELKALGRARYEHQGYDLRFFVD